MVFGSNMGYNVAIVTHFWLGLELFMHSRTGVQRL